jgi:uncharacterized protein (TIGR02596 family)
MKTTLCRPGLGRKSSAHRAFTLVEMLGVLGIIAIMTALIIPAAAPILRGSQLSQSAVIVIDQLNLARQSALTLNSLVEVRFYQFGDPDIPNESISSPNTGRFRAIQIFAISATGAATPLEKVQRLAGLVVIDSGTTLPTSLSSIIGLATASSAWPPASWPGEVSGSATTLNVPIPRVSTSYNCVCFRYLADGSTNLSPISQQWYLTVHNFEAGDALTAPPRNFFTVAINPTNGHLQSYRP